MKKTPSAIMTIALVKCAFGVSLGNGTLSVGDNETYSLNEDISITRLEIGKKASIDLNGHNLTVGNGATGVFSPSSTTDSLAMITNSVEGTTSAVKFELTQAIGSQEFTKVVFGGDLQLELKDVKFNETTGFGDRVNTHTGGTVLDHVYTENESMPRINNVNGLGTGNLTLRNSSEFRLIRGTGTLPWPEIIVESGKNIFYVELDTTYNGKVTVADGAEFCLADGRNGFGYWTGATFNVAKGGTFGFKSRTTATGRTNIESDFEGCLKIGGTSQFRYNGTGGSDGAYTTWNLGALASYDDENEPQDNYFIRVANVNANILVGSADIDTTYWGSFKSESHTYGHDFRITKVGTGIQTMGGTNNTYTLGTEIIGGAMRLTGRDATLGTGEIVFSGGTLSFASDVTNVANNLVCTNGQMRLNAEKDAFVTLSGSLNNVTNGFVKSGQGTVKIANQYDCLIEKSSVTNTIEEGILELHNASSTTPNADANFLGSGTLRIYGSGDRGYRMKNPEMFSKFNGTLEWKHETATGSACGILDVSDRNWGGMRLSIIGDPETKATVFHIENQNRTITLKAFDITSPNSVVNNKNNSGITFGASGEDSVINGRFSGQTMTMIKNGTGSLTIGEGFDLENGSLTVNGGTLIWNKSSMPSCTLTLADNLTFGGSGKIGSSYVTKASGFVLSPSAALTVDGAVDLTGKTIALTPPANIDQTETYVFLTATTINGFSSSTAEALLATLNAGEKSGKWKMKIRNNADGTKSMVLSYSKYGLMIVVR